MYDDDNNSESVHKAEFSGNNTAHINTEYNKGKRRRLTACLKSMLMWPFINIGIYG